MSSTESRRLRSLGPALDDLLRRCTTFSLEALQAAFDEVQARFAPLTGSSPELRLEVQRRVAETHLRAALFNECPLALAQQLFARLCALGFADTPRHVTMTIVYAKLCAASGHHPEALRVMRELVANLMPSEHRALEVARAEAARVLAELTKE